jgi:hypothetical protein
MINLLTGPRVRSALFWVTVGAGTVLALAFVDAGIFRRDWTVEKALSLLTALAILSGSVVWFAVTWRMILDGLAGRRVFGAVGIFIYTWLARYVPGTVPYHSARLLKAESMGVSRMQVVTSIGYESILILGMAGFVGVVCLVIGTGIQSGNALLYTVGGMLVAALPIGLHPAILVPSANRLLKLAGRARLDPGTMLSARQTLVAAVLYGAGLAGNGVAFYLIARVTGPEHPGLFLAVGAFCLAGAAGIAVPFVPSGLGVREAVIVTLLAGTMSTDASLALAATVRALTIVADILPPAILAAFHLLTRLRGTSTTATRQVPSEQAGLEAGHG